MPGRIEQIDTTKTEKLNSLGICIGASSVSIAHVVLDSHTKGNSLGTPCTKPEVSNYSVYPHEGDPQKIIREIFESLKPESFDNIAITGRKFINNLNLSKVSEPEAVEYAYKYVKPENIACPAIVSAGGETFMAYILNGKGKIINVITGNKCASGTGEFFLQQLRRMNVSLAEAAEWSESEEPYEVSGRCSVFCKSDCTHAINKGIPKSRVTSGLCRAMADKILELLKNVEPGNIMLTGGTAQNRVMCKYLEQEISDLIVPQEASYFEALGAALWALENKTDKPGKIENLFTKGTGMFCTLEPIESYKSLVEFKSITTDEIKPGDDCLLGLDVGSTTTKAVLVRETDNAILSQVYLLTNGDPIEASRQCYSSILNQINNYIDPDEIIISGLGICGSGRQIAALHAQTNGVINEIIAHANAAVYFDPQVDTIFEIGGQDAKYTHITGSVPSDYAMNEACSAGTGSFLEESVYEMLGIEMEDIAEYALSGDCGPNFNDQCAAFISSDIKNAIHDGVKHDDIIAGLVYSVCMNYLNRVKGDRPVGNKIFMQGGVCYNRAVPIAMAGLLGKKIIVPPEPGLMGAFGAALNIKNKINDGLIEKKNFNLEDLNSRKVNHLKPFNCNGSNEDCDRNCAISLIEIDGKNFPFGGACNKYYNIRYKIEDRSNSLDLVRKRQRLIFNKYAGDLIPRMSKAKTGRIGINRSFWTNTYFPLFFNFFSELGFKPIVPNSISRDGINRLNASFCYPGEQSIGYFHSLIQGEKNLDYLFLPHFKAIPAEKENTSSQVCPLSQGEPFYLKSIFNNDINILKKNGTKLLIPLLDLTKGLTSIEDVFTETAIQMGCGESEAKKAFKAGLKAQQECESEFKSIGEDVLKELDKYPESKALIIFGRPYNGFIEEGNMGIPQKIASRGITVMPFDFLPIDNELGKKHMYWGIGQYILKAAEFVKNHPQLFAVFITNFSCGPDSFLITYFRDIMGRKPSLTLELDNHTADTGLETRIDAFLDIISSHEQANKKSKGDKTKNKFTPATAVVERGKIEIITSSGEKIPATSPNVTILIPPFGKIAGDSAEAVVNGAGYNVVVHEEPDEEILKLGRANTTCKECLPLILTTGILLNYYYNKKKDAEKLIYVMPTASGPCRFGQYNVFIEDLIKKQELKDVALFTLTSENSYAGFNISFERRAWWAALVSDVIEDFKSMILANAEDVNSAMKVFYEEWALILKALENWKFSKLKRQLTLSAERLSKIPMKRPVNEVPVITLTGEIFIRRDSISRQFLTERLAKRGFAVLCSPNSEWMHYSDYLVDRGLVDYRMSTTERLWFFLRKFFMRRDENLIKSCLSPANLLPVRSIDINTIIENALPHISADLAGEAILTVGNALTEIITETCGVIAIGPFGCMPNRLSEAILNNIMDIDSKKRTLPPISKRSTGLMDIDDLPFLAIESDGSPFPQLINAKLDAFCLRAKRLHERMLKHNIL